MGEGKQNNKTVRDDEMTDINADSLNEEKNDPDKQSDGFKKSKKKSSKEKKKIAELEKEIELVAGKNEELKDKYLRLVAEYDNYRKRTAKEIIALRESIQSDVIKDLLPLMDDFDRALEYCNNHNEDSVKEGLMIIHKKFTDFFNSKSIEEIEALHKEFDTDFHEAVTKAPAPSKKLKGKVIDVIQKGYKINDKVIRYSKVVVGE